MTVTASWTDPSAGGALDLSAGAIVSEANWDALVSNQLWLGGSAGVVTQRFAPQGPSFFGGIAESTTSGSYVNFTSNAATLTMTTAGGHVLFLAMGTLGITNSGAVGSIGAKIDGVGPTLIQRYTASTSPDAFPFALMGLYALSAASHTWQLAWSVTAGTLATESGTSFVMSAIEFRR